MFVPAQPDSNHVHKGALSVFLLWGGSPRVEEREVLSAHCVQGCPGQADSQPRQNNRKRQVTTKKVSGELLIELTVSIKEI